jgi:hypothetical protein
MSTLCLRVVSLCTQSCHAQPGEPVSQEHALGFAASILASPIARSTGRS